MVPMQSIFNSLQSQLSVNMGWYRLLKYIAKKCLNKGLLETLKVIYLVAGLIGSNRLFFGRFSAVCAGWRDGKSPNLTRLLKIT
jgi:hypothetical protein